MKDCNILYDYVKIRDLDWSITRHALAAFGLAEEATD